MSENLYIVSSQHQQTSPGLATSIAPSMINVENIVRELRAVIDKYAGNLSEARDTHY